MAEDKLDIYQDKGGSWRWRRTASNGNIVGASTQGYKSKSDCEANAHRSDSGDKWEFYKDAKEEWRWRRTASNGNIVGAASEGYKAKASAESNARRNGWSG